MNSVIEKEKKLNLALTKLKNLNLRNPNIKKNIENLNLQKNQLEIEKHELEKKYKSLVNDYNELSLKLDEIKNKEKIEKDFGGQLMWEPLPESRACRIKAVIDLGGWQDEDKWEEVHNKLIENCINLKKSFDPIIKDLIKKY